MFRHIPIKDAFFDKFHFSPVKDGSLSLHDKRKELRHNLQIKTKNYSKLFREIRKYGVFTPSVMRSAGFEYTGEEDNAKCKDCGLEISKWTQEMSPFKIHAEHKPNCPFVRSMHASGTGIMTSESILSTSANQTTSTSNEQEKPSKRQKIEATDLDSVSSTLFESSLLEQVRRRGFSHWPHRTIPSSAQMIEAGFFNCNVGDRVICIYCNLICQQWTPHTDDPCEVHKTLSPLCIFVKARLIRPAASSIIIVNEGTTNTGANSRSVTSNNFGPLRSNDIVFTAPCNPAFLEIPRRHQSFSTWPTDNLPAVDDLVRAGFFYTGTKSIVTCFYCNGSLQNWGSNDNPMIEHARWFPHCAYARQLCGDDLYRKIQESKRAQQERARANEARDKQGSSSTLNMGGPVNSRQLFIPDESTLSRLVAARLDLPVSQRLLDKNFKLSIIKRCWEDQLKIKHDDFVSDSDLYIACLILQKQIEHIDGKKENIVIPSIKMKQIREQNARMREQQLTVNISNPTVSSNSADVDISASQSTSGSESSQNEGDSSKSTNIVDQDETKLNKQTINSNDQSQSNNSTPTNPCVLCLAEEKRLACIPCGHMATCVACGHSLRSCPICRREIEAFVRIYV